MTPKGADLEATDLIEVSTIESGSYVTRSITGQELIDAIPAPSGFVPTSRTLTINGVAQDLSADRSWTIATGLTVGTTPISSGTNGRVLFQGTGNVLQQSSSLFWDSTNNRLGIGTSSPTNILTLGAAVAASLQSSAASIFTSNENASNVFVQVAASNDPVQRPVFAGTKARGTLLSPTAVQSGDAITTFLSTAFDGTAGQASAGLSFDAESNASSGNAPQLISFITGASGGTRTTKMQVRSNGNVLINTTTDAGFRLDVSGTARFSDNLTIQGNQKRLILRETISGSTFFGIDFIASNASTIASILSNQSSGEIRNFVASGGYFSTFYSNGSERMRIPTTGNVLINTTTDAGFRLDVNGTARVQSLLTLSNGSYSTAAIGWGAQIGFYYDASLGIITNIGGVTISSVNGTRFNFDKAVGIGTFNMTNDASARLQINSTTQGFLPPRMTTTQKNAIASPAAGLMVYDTTLNVISYYNGTSWI
jgi:hypothetical protein